MNQSKLRSLATHLTNTIVALWAISIFTIVACTKEQGIAAKDVTVKVAEEVCKELATDAGTESAWALIACSAGTGIVKVLLPRDQWRAMRGQPPLGADAGLRPLPLNPGK